MNSDIATAARCYLNSGLSVIPINPSTKRSALTEWAPYQKRQPTETELDHWIHDDLQSLAVVCGSVSGGLEILDFDHPDFYEEWSNRVNGRGEILPVQRTGGGGFQAAMRRANPGRNQKLAWYPDPGATSGRSIAIETRGEGGYALLPPSLHPSGNYYEMIRGDFANIPLIEPTEADFLIQTARSLDQAPKTKQELFREHQEHEQRIKQEFGGDSVIDAYNEKHDIEESLCKYGYTELSNGRWSRPDQPESGGVVVFKKDNKSYHYSSNDLLTSDHSGRNQPRSPFDYFTFYEHNGDYKAAVKAAAKELGMKPKKKRQQQKSAALFTALEGLGYDFRLNVLEDNVEVDRERLNDVIQSEINLKMLDLGYSRPSTLDAINVIAGRNTHHPIKDYLSSLKWDGENHLARMLKHFRGDGKSITFPSGQQTPLHHHLIWRWLLGCVARGLDSGKRDAFKHQTPMLVIIGKQGLGKSSWVRWLVSGVGYEFHREGPINPNVTEDVRCMVNRWIWEVSELASSLRRADRNALKGFITQEWHTYRKPYGKHPITKPTLCNLVGTLNPETGFLDDPSGNRRFLPVNITKINHGYKDKVDVDQLWAQLVHMYQEGESPELTPLEKEVLTSCYAEHEVENPLKTYLQMYFNIEPGNEQLRCHTAMIIQRLFEFNVWLSQNPKVVGREINDALAPMGLERRKISVEGVKGMGWIGISPNSQPSPI
ncbi:bifunctional DNA primase/polymerase [Chloroflexi bacterium TSY]|nr:bifunctional DNA primase/polymerase [Chloroflexi bacterium TSY]